MYLFTTHAFYTIDTYIRKADQKMKVSKREVEISSRVFSFPEEFLTEAPAQKKFEPYKTLNLVFNHLLRLGQTDPPSLKSQRNWLKIVDFFF